jgi:hypothetical protein
VADIFKNYFKVNLQIHKIYALFNLKFPSCYFTVTFFEKRTKKLPKSTVLSNRIVDSGQKWDKKECCTGSTLPGGGAEMGKHPDLLVAHPTSTIFMTIGRNYEIS